MNSSQAYQICSRCVMDTSAPDIRFDEHGVCNLCTEFIEKRALHVYKGAESDNAFHASIAEMKRAGQGRPYDCVVGLSGGIDSSYAAFKLHQYGLRILAVHVDNGWNAEEAVLNIKNIADKLKIDYQSFVLNWLEFRDIQLAFLKASVPEAETPTDIALLGALHQVAKRNNIKYIVSGGNLATEGILPKHWHYNAKDGTYFNAIQKQFGTKKISSFPFFSFWTEFYYKFILGIKIKYVLNLLPYNKEYAIAEIKEHLQWREYGGKHHESKYTGFIQSYYLPTKFGIDYRRATLSSQICLGVIEREDALVILRTPPYKENDLEPLKAYVAKKLNVSVQDLEKIISSKPKWYSDYRNNEKLLNTGYNLYRWLFKKAKLGNF